MRSLISIFSLKIADFLLICLQILQILPEFWAQADEEALRKDEIARPKRNTEKGKGRGQASEKVRSPLHLTWKRVQARGTEVHACGARILLNFC